MSGAAPSGVRVGCAGAIALMLVAQVFCAHALAPGAARSAALIGLLALECGALLFAEPRGRRGWVWLLGALAVFAPYFVVVFSDARWRYR